MKFGIEALETVKELSRKLVTILRQMVDRIEALEKGGFIDYQSQIDELTSRTVPIGTPSLWFTNTAPPGWLLCDGTAVSRSIYSDLFNIIGTQFGVGDGSTTFNLPNPDGLVPRFTGSQLVNGRMKVGPTNPGDIQEDQTQKNTGSVSGILLRNAGTPSNSGSLSVTTASNTLAGFSASTQNIITAINTDSANSPNARTSSTTDGETRVSSLGFNLIIKT